MADWMNKPMPPGWEQKFDPRVNRYYYVNHATRKRVIKIRVNRYLQYFTFDK